jgi:hypothetical protein
MADSGNGALVVTAPLDVAALLADPMTAATTVPPMAVPRLVTQLAALVIALTAQRAAALNIPEEDDDVLTIEEVASRLKVTKDWLRRRPGLPFVVKLSEGTVRYSRRALRRFIAEKMQKDA